MELSTLSEPERAALAKAEAAGVNITIDGVNTPLAREASAAASANSNANADIKTEVTSHVAAAATDAAAAKSTRPEYIPEKFWDAATGTVRSEAMAKSYRELETAASKPKAADVAAAAMADAAAAAAAETPEAKAAAATAAAAEAAKAPDLTAQRAAASQQATKDINETGKITDASYAELAKVGYSRAEVDTYVEGIQAKSQLYLNSMYDSAGGKDNYTKMIEWGKTSFTAEEVVAFDGAIRSGDAGSMKLAIGGLKSRYTAEFGTSSKSITPNNSQQQSNNDGFKSAQEMRDAMKDSRYTKGDPTFHREVAQKIAAADRAGVDLGIRIHGR